MHAPGRRRVEDEGRIVTSTSYTNWTRVQRWSESETVAFYDALRVFGTDFEAMSHLFREKGRDRRQLKNKFNREYKLKPAEIENALKNRDVRGMKALYAQVQNLLPSQAAGEGEDAERADTPAITDGVAAAADGAAAQAAPGAAGAAAAAAGAAAGMAVAQKAAADGAGPSRPREETPPPLVPEAIDTSGWNDDYGYGDEDHYYY